MKTRKPNQAAKPAEAGAGKARVWKRRPANLVDIIISQGMLDYVRAGMADFKARKPELYAALLALGKEEPKKEEP